jgi:tRNA (cytidine32/guanosine34-2'-O)-methyltransferase
LRSAGSAGAADSLLEQSRAFHMDTLAARIRNDAMLSEADQRASIEAFVVCQGFAPPPGFAPARLQALLDRSVAEGEAALEDDPGGVNELIVPFLACGDLSGRVPRRCTARHYNTSRSFDADQTYPLPEADGAYVPLPPVQPPISPAYLAALQRDRALAHRIGGAAANAA